MAEGRRTSVGGSVAVGRETASCEPFARSTRFPSVFGAFDPNDADFGGGVIDPPGDQANTDERDFVKSAGGIALLEISYAKRGGFQLVQNNEETPAVGAHSGGERVPSVLVQDQLERAHGRGITLRPSDVSRRTT